MLKLIAIITMIIDHIGAGILEPLILNGYFGKARSVAYQFYWTARFVGRLAFPIYCYLLMLGFMYTHSRIRYMGRMLLFVVLSELPYDYLFYAGFTNAHQNVFWTLFFGLVAMWGAELLLGDSEEEKHKSIGWRILGAVLVGAAVWGGYFFHTDYGWKGVLLVLLIYLLRRDRAAMCVTAPTVFLAMIAIDRFAHGADLEAIMNNLNLQWSVFISFYLIMISTGKRRKQPQIVKWAAYWVYPVHMCVLLMIRYLLVKG